GNDLGNTPSGELAERAGESPDYQAKTTVEDDHRDHGDHGEGSQKLHRDLADPGHETGELAPVPSSQDLIASASDTLGDTDLIEALLQNPEGLRNLALRLIKQHTQWEDLALREAPSAAADSQVAAPKNS